MNRKFDLEQQNMDDLTAKGESEYAQGKCNDVISKIEEHDAIFDDDHYEQFIAHCEVVLRERHENRERAVKEYADDLPF